MSRLALLLLTAVLARSEVIDRIAVSVGKEIISGNDIVREIRLAAFLNHTAPDLSAAEKRSAAERLIERTLIRHEMDVSHFPLPPLEDADPMLRGIESGYPNRQAFLDALGKYGITEQDVRERLLWQLTTLRFIEERFRPSVQISEADLREFYNQQAAKWKQDGVTPIASFEESREKLEQLLMERRVDRALDRWIGDARTQVDIKFRPGAFE